MRFKILIALLVLVVIVIAMFILQPRKAVELEEISMPPGYEISIFAENLGQSPVNYPGPAGGSRFMLAKDDVVYVSISKNNIVLALPDKNNDGKADEKIVFIDGLNNPHGIDYYDGWFYIAEENRVIRVKDDDNDLKADDGSLEVVVPSLPTGGHWTRTVKVYDGKIYVSIGSSCNNCVEEDKRRGAILECTFEGECEVYVSGIRNAVGFIFYEGKIYATENARDWAGEDLPPDEINIVEKGRHYGWPYCFGKNIPDPEYSKPELCKDKEPSFVDLQAHSAPLGLAFYEGDLFVAFHGSWNRDVPTGYKVVRINMEDKTVSDFATGWLKDGEVSGRPVDIIVFNDALLVSDDLAGKIYRISKS